MIQKGHLEIVVVMYKTFKEKHHRCTFDDWPKTLKS
jgi:hypothetical protein